MFRMVVLRILFVAITLLVICLKLAMVILDQSKTLLEIAVCMA